MDDFSRSADGIAGGGQVGCDYQFASNWVIGIQGMVDATGIEADRVSVLFPSTNIHARVRGFATLTGRIGYTITPSFLLYGKFGWGGYRTRLTFNDTVTGVGASATRAGPKPASILASAASGCSRPTGRCGSNGTAFSRRKRHSSSPALGATAEVRREFDKVLVGVNWRFGGAAAPVAARY